MNLPQNRKRMSESVNLILEIMIQKHFYLLTNTILKYGVLDKYKFLKKICLEIVKQNNNKILNSLKS